jgi:transcriptional regulator with XRE-family HTH domain
MKGRKYLEEWEYLGERLRKARVEAGLSQYEVAKIIDRTQSYVSKLEKGYVRIDIVQLKEFGDLYRRGVDFFLKVNSE